MSIHSTTRLPTDAGYISIYLDALALVERLHRLLLDVIKDEFERVGVFKFASRRASSFTMQL